MKAEVEEEDLVLYYYINQQVLQNRTGVRTRLVSAEMREELGDRVLV